jgi:hypothetical protein
MSQTTAIYPCSQKDLYSVLETAWGNFGTATNLPRFTAFKGLYVAAFKTAAIAAIAAAKAMPDDDARTGTAEVLHIGLINMGKICTQNFQFLKSYIETAFPDPLVQDVQFVIAGQNYYRGATNRDWESLELLNQSMKNYLAIPANNTLLLGVGPNLNMPATFTASVTTAAANFSTQYANFKAAEQTSLETTNKVKANNAIYKAGISMMKDGQLIFMNEDESRVKFEFSSLLALINPPVAGVKGSIKEAVTNKIIVGAQMTSQLDGEVAKAVDVDDTGEFDKELQAGKYTLVVSALGYVTETRLLDLKLTGLKIEHFLLVKI